MATSELLAELRDIELPPPPPADFGGMFIPATLLLLISLGIIIWALHRRRYRWANEAVALLNKTESEPPEEQLASMAKIMRRITALRAPGEV